MRQAPIIGQWIPLPINQAFKLAVTVGANTILVWISMMNDGLKNENGLTSRMQQEISKETKLSISTVRKAQNQLSEAGLITKIKGKGKNETVFEITPIASFYGRPQLPTPAKTGKPVGTWTL